MDKVSVNYKITIYDGNRNIKIIDNLFDTIDSNILFSNIIDALVSEDSIKYFQIYVENLKNNTQGRY